MIRNYLKIAWRNLGKNKIYSSINIIGLAVGMAVAVLIGLWVWDEISFNKSHRNYDRLAQLMVTQTFNGQTETSMAISIPSSRTLRTKYPTDFTQVALSSWKNTNLLVNEEKKLNKTGVYAEEALPEMLSLKMLAGAAGSALKDPGSILISKSLAESLFGMESPINKIVRLDTKNNMKVTGVYEDIPFNSEFHKIDFMIPWVEYGKAEQWVKNADEQWKEHSFQCYVQLSAHADLDKLSGKIRDMEKPYSKVSKDNPEYFLQPMSKWHLYGEFENGKNVGGNIQFVILFSIIGVFVLLLACINFMNLSTARSEKRAREVGVRKAVGSLQSQLVSQFLTESFLVVVLALIVAFTLVLLVMPVFNELSGKQLSFPYQIPAFWISVIVFTVFTGFIAGSYPAFYLSSFHPLQVLKGTLKVGKAALVPRKVMVIAQFTVSITLVIGTIIVFQQIEYAKNRPVGYNREGLLQIEMVSGHYGKYDLLRDDLIKSGVVSEFSESSSPTTGIQSNQIGFDWEGKDPTFIPLFGTIACTHDFGKTIGWKILQGRDFSREFSTDSSGIILNEAAVKLMGLHNVVGKVMKHNGQDRRIIGVAQDMVMNSPYTPAYPTVFLLDYEWANVINVKLKPGSPVDQALKKVETIFNKYESETPFSFKFADQEYDAKFRAEVRVGKLAGIFTVLAIFISCLGLFGLATFTAEQRTKEIGIRKTLGASVVQMWMMLSKEFVYLVAISCLIATPVAFYTLTGWLQKYQYKISISWKVFVAAALASILITLATVSFQAVKAALMNPVKSLRSE